MVCSLIRLDNGQPFVASASIVTNDDGSVSFLLPDEQSIWQYVGQEPNMYGVRHDGLEKQQYQRATLSGSMVTFVTRDGDLPCVYLCGQGKVYPS